MPIRRLGRRISRCHTCDSLKSSMIYKLSVLHILTFNHLFPKKDLFSSLCTTHCVSTLKRVSVVYWCNIFEIFYTKALTVCPAISYMLANSFSTFWNIDINIYYIKNIWGTLKEHLRVPPEWPDLLSLQKKTLRKTGPWSIQCMRNSYQNAPSVLNYFFSGKLFRKWNYWTSLDLSLMDTLNSIYLFKT